MARTDKENAIIQEALVFYQRHLLLERQNHESHLPKNGKLAARAEDDARENAWDRRLHTIAGLLQSQQGAKTSVLNVEARSNSYSPFVAQAFKQELDTDPDINPFADEWVIPEPKFTPGPSNATSSSDDCGLVDIAKSMAISDGTPAVETTKLAASNPIVKPDGRMDDTSVARTKSKASGSSSIKRKPLNTSEPTGQHSVPPLPELYGSSITPPVNANMMGRDVLSVELSIADRTAPKESTINPRSPDPARISPTLERIPRHGGSFNSQERPWAFVSNPTEESPGQISPPMQPQPYPGWESSWESASRMHLLSSVQKPATPNSSHSQHSQEAAWNETPQTPPPNVVVSDTTFVPQQHHNRSRSSLSVERLPKSPSPFDIQYRSQPYWSPTQQPPMVSKPGICFRERPTFNIAGLGKFGEPVGAQTFPQPQQIHGINGTEPSRFSSANGSVASFSLERQQPSFNNGEPGTFLGEHGSGRTHHVDGGQKQEFHAPMPGGFPTNQGNGGVHAYAGGPGQLDVRPTQPIERNLPNISSPQSLPKFPGSFVSQPPIPVASVVSKGPGAAHFGSGQADYIQQLQSFNGHANQQTEIQPAHEIEGDQKTNLAYASDFASVSEFNAAKSGSAANNHATQFDPGLRSFHDRLDGYMKHNQEPSQGHSVPSQMGYLSWSSARAGQSHDAGWGLSNGMSQDLRTRRPSTVPNDMLPNSLNPNRRRQADPSNVGQGQSSLSSQLSQSLSGPNEVAPNQLTPNAIGVRSSFDAGISASSMKAQYQQTFVPLGSENGTVPNQLWPVKPGNVVMPGQHSSPPTRNAWPPPKDSFNGSGSMSQQDEIQEAQAIADRADLDELAALQRMQDEFNREDESQLANQEAFARSIQDAWNAPSASDFGRKLQEPFSLGHSQPQPSSRNAKPGTTKAARDPPQRRQSCGDSDDDSVQFAPALQDDDIHPDIVVKPPKVIRPASASPPQTRPISNPKPPAQARSNFDAAKAADEEIAKYNAAQQALEDSARQSALDKIKAAQAAAKAQSESNKLECIALCGDKDYPSAMALLPCNHAYCGTCIADAFKHAFAAGKVFICCNKTPAPVDIAAPFLPVEFVAQYKIKMEERASPNPIYCAKPGCSAFISPTNLKGPLATCGKCGFVSCSLCKNPEHKGVCPPDQLGLKLMDLAENKNWTQCTRCKAIVERDEGCLHMTCTCGYEFCYSCSGRWDQCGGRCPRKS